MLDEQPDNNAAAPSPVQMSNDRRRLLYTPDDEEYLSDLICLTRKQIEVFAATPDDIAARGRRTGNNQHVDVGRVGIRCIHCSHSPSDQRAKGSSSYPLSINIMHQAVRNWQRYHFDSCDKIPAEVKEQYRAFQRNGAHSRKASKRYWVESCVRIGLIDAKDGTSTGIRFNTDNFEGSDGSGCDDEIETSSAATGQIKTSPSKGESTGIGDGLMPSTLSMIHGEESDKDQVGASFYPADDSFVVDLEEAAENVLEADFSASDLDHLFRDFTDFSPGTEQQSIGATGKGQAVGPLATPAEDTTSFPAQMDHIVPISPSASPGMKEGYLATVEISKQAQLINQEGTVKSRDRNKAVSMDRFQTDAAVAAPSVVPTEYAANAMVDGGSHGSSASEPLDRSDAFDCASVSACSSPMHELHVFRGTGSQEDNAATHIETAAPTGSKNATNAKDTLLGVSNETESDAKLLGKVQLAYSLVEAIHGMNCIPEASSAPGGISYADLPSQDDLFSLGVELYEHFAGCRPFTDDSNSSAEIHAAPLSTVKPYGGDRIPEEKREKRLKKRGNVSLRDLGFPVSLCNLVLSLLGEDIGGDSGRNVQCYHSIDQVKEDLRRMAYEPDRYLFDAKSEAISGRLQFPCGRLYGRESQLLKLMDAYDRISGSDGPREIVLVSGYCGTGKSSLAEQVRQSFVHKDSFFISGKFNELERAHPLSAIVAAFNQYCDILLARDRETIHQMRIAIEGNIGFEGKVLTDLIPNLSKVIGGEQFMIMGSSSLGRGSLNRLEFLFREFVKAIASPSHPLILFIDDLQWADEASLELIRSILMDSSIKSLLVIGCYRDNAVGNDHPLTRQLRCLKGSALVRVSEVEVGNIDKESVNALISDTLRLSPCVTDSLTDIVFRKTSGNVLFVLQFLSSLHDEGLLRFSLLSRCWEWDIQGIQSKDIADNVVELLKSKMSKMSSEVQRGLKTIACLGCQFDALILEVLSREDIDEYIHLRSTVDIAVGEGLMFRVGSLYRFAHDQIQQVAYSLIPDHEALHLAIGRRLWEGASETEMENIRFVVTEQMNRGSDLIFHRREKIALARLNLKAGEKALSSSAYLAASVYFELGVGLLKQDDWIDNYDLCLSLYNSLADTLCIVGKATQASAAINEVLSLAKTFHDKLNAYYTLVSSLGTQGKTKDAIEIALAVLDQLGEPFPKESDNVLLRSRDFSETKCMLDKMTAEAVLQSPTMKDTDKIAAMRFLDVITMYSYQSQPDLFGLVASRMVQISLRNGVCKESALGFSAFAMIVSCVHGNLREGYCIGKLALSLLKRFKAKDCIPRVYAAVYGLINSLIEPLQSCLEVHLEAHRVGLLTGDPEYAMLNGHQYLSFAVQCGRPLEPLAEEMKDHIGQMSEYNQDLSLSLTQPFYQFVLNLMGRSEDVLTLTGDAMDQESFLWEMLERNTQNSRLKVYIMRLWLAYLFGRYELAGEMVDEILEFERDRGMLGGQMSIVYVGLASIALARLTKKDKWMKIARKYAEKMEDLAKIGPWNFQHKLDLMNAEFYFLLRDNERAAKAYGDAIKHARAHKFVHEAGLAHERAAIFYSETGDEASQKDHYRKARHCYSEWGATRKVAELESLCS